SAWHSEFLLLFRGEWTHVHAQATIGSARLVYRCNGALPELSDVHGDILAGSLAPDVQPRRASRLQIGDLAGEIVRPLDIVPVEFQNHVARLQSCVCGRTMRLHRTYQSAGGLLQAER